VLLCCFAAVCVRAGGVLLGVVVVAVLAATVLTSKAPGPETLQTVSRMTHHMAATLADHMTDAAEAHWCQAVYALLRAPVCTAQCLG
jgi:hypothetical protein